MGRFFKSNKNVTAVWSRFCSVDIHTPTHSLTRISVPCAKMPFGDSLRIIPSHLQKPESLTVRILTSRVTKASRFKYDKRPCFKRCEKCSYIHIGIVYRYHIGTGTVVILRTVTQPQFIQFQFQVQVQVPSPVSGIKLLAKDGYPKGPNG
jgi:hypothetical protein